MEVTSDNTVDIEDVEEISTDDDYDDDDEGIESNFEELDIKERKQKTNHNFLKLL